MENFDGEVVEPLAEEQLLGSALGELLADDLGKLDVGTLHIPLLCLGSFNSTH